jgi:hypothetical protein
MPDRFLSLYPRCARSASHFPSFRQFSRFFFVFADSPIRRFAHSLVITA